MKTIRIAFRQFTDVGLRKKAEHIYDSLKENPVYAALAALLATVKTALDKYCADLAAAGTNDRFAVAQKNKSRGELADLLRQLRPAVPAGSCFRAFACKGKRFVVAVNLTRVHSFCIFILRITFRIPYRFVVKPFTF